jgi:hypothetical protein
VNWNCRPGTRGDRRLQQFGVEIVAARSDIHEANLCADHGCRFSGGDKGIGYGDHLVARTDPASKQGDPQRIRAAAYPDCEASSAILRKSRFEAFHVWPGYERGIFYYRCDGGVDFLAQRPILGVKIDEGNFHIDMPAI